MNFAPRAGIRTRCTTDWLLGDYLCCSLITLPLEVALLLVLLRTEMAAPAPMLPLCCHYRSVTSRVCGCAAHKSTIGQP